MQRGRYHCPRRGKWPGIKELGDPITAHWGAQSGSISFLLLRGILSFILLDFIVFLRPWEYVPLPSSLQKRVSKSHTQRLPSVLQLTEQVHFHYHRIPGGEVWRPSPWVRILTFRKVKWLSSKSHSSVSGRAQVQASGLSDSKFGVFSARHWKSVIVTMSGSKYATRSHLSVGNSFSGSPGLCQGRRAQKTVFGAIPWISPSAKGSSWVSGVLVLSTAF